MDKGTLYIVSTPIGNLADITLRAIEVLKSVDSIICEDTRVTGKLLNHLQIDKKMFALNDFNEAKQVHPLISRLAAGENLALVSDAGTPLISDPGYKLVREAIREGIKVESIPGSSSVIVALIVSGLPPDKILFVGYLPKKDAKRKILLEDIKKSRQIVKSTIIAFESPFRLLKTLEDVKEIFGDIEIVICRELTKMHEEVKRGKVSELIGQTLPKGEITILL